MTTLTREQLVNEIDRVSSLLSVMDDKYDAALVEISKREEKLAATYPWLRQLYAMWPNEKLKEFLAASGEF